MEKIQMRGRVPGIDYYWKDYRGDVPEDAVKGGSDEVGNPTYIGQGYFGAQGLLPGTIRKGCGVCINTEVLRTAIYGYAHTSNVHIKILCSTSPDKMKWIRTSATGISGLIHQHLVSGGVFYDQILYIGRAFHNLSSEVGPVMVNDKKDKKGLHLPEDKNEVVMPIFDVLTYNSGHSLLRICLNND